MTLTEIDATIEQARDDLREAAAHLESFKDGGAMEEVWNRVGALGGSVNRVLREYRRAVTKGTNQ